MTKKLCVTLIMCAFMTVLSYVASLSVDIDMSSLLALKSGFNSDILAKNWSQEVSYCTWIGVTCGRRHPRVTALNLSGMDLHGRISREIGNLSFLVFLNVGNNSISGPIPDEIGKMRRLRVLSMFQNQLSEHIPESMGLLSKLEHLNLSNNHLSGDIPASLSACGELIAIDLAYNSLTGNIPSSFGNLSHLQQLDLGVNQLTGELSSMVFNISSLLYFSVRENQMSGSIPKLICGLSSKLQVFWVSKNNFEGQFPSDLITCSHLIFLGLGNNNFGGIIPTQLWNLSSIQHLYLDYTYFTSVIPPSVADLTKLVTLHIQGSNFHGSIPPEIGLLSGLSSLDLSKNMLNGEVPRSIFNLSSLQELALQMNNLSGYLPVSIDKGIPNIEHFYIFSNQFHGVIPNTISNLSKLSILEISNNSFSGHVPITLGNLPRLQYLNLFSNQFSNNISVPEQDFLSSLTSCQFLQHIAIAENPITGVLPKSLGNLSASFRNLYAYSCQLRSPVPDEIGNLSNLIMLALGNNELTGALPAALGNIRSLQVLSMPYNKFQGPISQVICNLENIFGIGLQGNNLVGQPPRCFQNLSSLRILSLENNTLNFTISSTLWINKHIERLYMSDNLIRGSIPGEIGNLVDLIELDLSRNQLSGKIPSSISQLQKLSTLSLSNNKLSGSIPPSLEKLLDLMYFNVSFNELSGEIPDGGPFLNFSFEFFVGNKGLCGASRFKVGECKRSTTQKPSSRKKLLKCIPAVTVAVVLVAIIVIFVQRRRARKPPPSSLFESPIGVALERISRYEILRATNNLDDSNLIGKGSFGSIYKAIFSNSSVAAVKVFKLEVQGALVSFEEECEILRNIRHKNLVKVITSCSNLDFKALVMAYMSNGDLEKWLYSSNTCLNLFQRVGIMIDVASAVEYLHQGYTSSIIHCDLKPNNILLDENMVAHVADFGIAKLLPQELRIQHTTTLGTIGYIAPEYGSEGIVSTMVDVYSYGILLMEVFTRTRPTNDLFSGDLTMRGWVSQSFPNSVMQIIDDELLDMDDEQTRTRHERCLTEAIKLALECTTNLAKERPNMKDVVTRMNKIKFNLSIRNG